MSHSVPLTALVVVIAVGLMMLVELQLSLHNERGLRARGAVEPPDDVYRWMRIAYPLGFVLIGAEGALNDVLPRDRLFWGLAVFTAAKALKFWAISSLGWRWSFRVLVVPGEPLVATGPYAWVRHPNYIALIGEYAGVALMMSAPVTGVLVILGFGWLLWRRTRAEERALGFR